MRNYYRNQSLSLEDMFGLFGGSSRIIPWNAVNTTPEKAAEVERRCVLEAMEIVLKTHPMCSINKLDEEKRADAIIEYEQYGILLSSLCGEADHNQSHHVAFDEYDKTFDKKTQRRVINAWDYIKTRRLKLERPRDRGHFFDKIVVSVFQDAIEKLDGFFETCALLRINGAITCVPRKDNKPRIAEAFAKRCAEKVWAPGGAVHKRLESEIGYIFDWDETSL